jgi:hypothetical protein
MIKIYIRLHLNYPLYLSDVNETCIFSADFTKKLQEDTNCELGHSKQTDVMQVIVAFRNVATALNYWMNYDEIF